MISSAIAPLTTPSISTSVPPSSLETTLKAAVEHARRLSTLPNPSRIDLAIAWETVDELQTAHARKQVPQLSSFAQYCAANPNALECRIYDM